jgi:inositol phosphorylceramide mannosyltransferase catalytic subunit
MKRSVIPLALILVITVYFSVFRKAPSSDWIPFDASMGKASSSFVKCYSNNEGQRWKWLKNLYERGVAKPGQREIPKIIHQIWIGGPIPEKYNGIRKTWKEKNPDWEYRLWTDADLPAFPFTDRKRFEKAISVGEKADILRYDILLHFGGLYVDTDFECLKSFDPIHSTCDFYVGLEAAFCEDQAPAMGNALIASIPGHPILKYCLKDISKRSPGTTPDEVQSVSGPGCLRKAFFKQSNQKGFKNIAFPYTFFYPIPSSHRRDERREEWIEGESFGVHYWDISWVQ